jgi:hypothetical protein
LHLRLPSSRLGCLLLTYVLNWTRRQELHLREAALQAAAYSCSATAWCWGDRLGLHQLQRGHGPRAIYFAFCHELVPSAGLAPAWSCWDRLVLSQVCLLIPPRGHQKWCSVSESNRSLALERRGVSPETQRNVAIVRRLELRKPGLRGLLLEPLCIHDHIWWSASESHRSGYLLARQIRVPSPHPKNWWLVTPTTRPARIRWPRLPATSRLVPPGGLEPPSRRLRGGTLAR